MLLCNTSYVLTWIVLKIRLSALICQYTWRWNKPFQCQITPFSLCVSKQTSEKINWHFQLAFWMRQNSPGKHIPLLRLCAKKNKPVHRIWLQCWPTVWQITILPQVLNTLSAGVLVAGIQRYFLANWQTCVELTSCSFHRRGSVSLSAGGVWKELFSSALIASVIHSREFAIIFCCLESRSEGFLFLFLLFLHLLQHF